jgi:hypothetical protein
MFLYHFNVLISKIILKKYYFEVFLSENHFKKQLQPYFQTRPVHVMKPGNMKIK